MTKVYQCDRCKVVFEPRVLNPGEPYIARKARPDLDLCPTCHVLLKDFLGNYDKEAENATETACNKDS